jgi:hypothetical protein
MAEFFLKDPSKRCQRISLFGDPLVDSDPQLSGDPREVSTAPPSETLSRFSLPAPR